MPGLTFDSIKHHIERIADYYRVDPTPEALCHFSCGQILSFKNIGRKKLRLIEAWLAESGLKMNTPPHYGCCRCAQCVESLACPQCNGTGRIVTSRSGIPAPPQPPPPPQYMDPGIKTQ